MRPPNLLSGEIAERLLVNYGSSPLRRRATRRRRGPLTQASRIRPPVVSRWFGASSAFGVFAQSLKLLEGDRRELDIDSLAPVGPVFGGRVTNWPI